MYYQDHQTYFRIHSIKFFFVLSTGTAYFSPFLKYFSVGNSEMWNLSARALLTVASTAARTPELWDGGEANHARQPQTRCRQNRGAQTTAPCSPASGPAGTSLWGGWPRGPCIPGNDQTLARSSFLLMGRDEAFKSAHQAGWVDGLWLFPIARDPGKRGRILGLPLKAMT